MKILAIETSCDETALAIVEVVDIKNQAKFKILANEISSQVNIHKEYGGVFPMMAKREHGRNIVHLTEKLLKSSKLYKKIDDKYPLKTKNKINKILDRENDLLKIFTEILYKINKPKIDAIAITTGPGLEPALWVGISFAKALSVLWDIPIVPVNHMEGHIFSVYPNKRKTFTINYDNEFPLLSLLVSGGHTEIILIKDWQKYKKIGQTRDDAAGEAFDKVARMLELPYPGGPEISRLADQARKLRITNYELLIKLPRPMIYTKDYDFSFSGLKTAVLYLIRDLKEKNPNILNDINIKQKIAEEFENAVVETLVHKTIKAIKQYKIKNLIVGGGVSANTYLQEQMQKEIKNIRKSDFLIFKNLKVQFPSKALTGDNALMIAIAGYFQYKNKKIAKNINSIKARGNLSLV